MRETESQTIAAELIAMAEEDGRVREELARDGSLFHGYHPRMQTIHDRNAGRLAAIIDAHGWPGKPVVGEQAAHAAWLILQHAIAHPALQRRGLDLVKNEADADPIETAMLEDRIRGFEGRGQVYGTQFDWDAAGEMSPLPIENPEGVDQRRASIGLGPLEAAITDHRAAVARGPEKPPADWDRRRRDLQAWLKRVGWRS